MVKVKVDKEKCIGCGACVAAAPDFFKFDENGKSQPTKEDITSEELETVEKAAELCPVGAIQIEKEEKNE